MRHRLWALRDPEEAAWLLETNVAIATVKEQAVSWEIVHFYG